MIPIGDVNPRRRFPAITALIILLNVMVYLYGLTLSEQQLEAFYLANGLIPAQLTTALSLGALASIFTSMFLHGGLVHLLSNMLYLWIFGDNVEDRLGKAGYLLFYLLAGTAAVVAQTAVHPSSGTPLIGASGAVAGVMGIYIVLFSAVRVRTMVIVLYFVRFIELPAVIVLGMWFVLQIFQGLASVGADMVGGVAWFAHIGGFALGLLTGFLLKRLGQRDASRYYRSAAR